jgi:hypothetical protein
MFPWKLLFRFFSAMVLFATGGFAAGHDLPLPFTGSPTEVAAPPATPVADLTTTTTTVPVVDPTPPVDGTTTTTTVPPVVVDPVPNPVPVLVPPTTPVPPKPVTTTTVPPAVPVVPVDGDAPSVCAAAATAVCGPAAPAPADTHAARVQRCQDWWNSLADAFDHNNRPEWAGRARDIAGRCEEMITRWEQMQQNGADHPKGDHNGDGHPDNGWDQGKTGHDGDHPTPPPAQPQPQPQPKQQVSRHGEGRH